MANQLGFYHNADNCIGCKACVVSCKDKNDLPLGEKYRRVYDYAHCDWDVSEKGVATPTNAYAYSVSMACSHCASPACFAVCPTDAIIKRETDGVVYIDEELCIGCGSCVTACPYGAPYMSGEDNKARKCDFCMDLLDEGEVPYCVASCSMRCLSYGDIDELRSEHGNVATLPPINDDTSTDPSMVFSPSRLNPDAEANGELLNTEEEIVSATV